MRHRVLVFLFAFLGTFTFVNFVLVRAPFGVSMMQLGLVYFVFLPAIVTTPLAGLVVTRFGRQPALWMGLAVAGVGLPLLVLPSLPVLLAGISVLVSVGTFLAQAIATGAVGHAAMTDRAAASGMYLFAYYLGGLLGTAALSDRSTIALAGAPVSPASLPHWPAPRCSRFV